MAFALMADTEIRPPLGQLLLRFLAVLFVTASGCQQEASPAESEGQLKSEPLPVLGAPQLRQGDEASDEVPPNSELSYINFAKPLLDRACATCHTSPAAAGIKNQMRLDSYYDLNGLPGVFSVRAKIETLLRQAKQMPQHDTLTTAENRSIRSWIAAGAVLVVGGESSNSRIPTGHFVESPPEGGGASVEFQNADKAATWDLYYTTVAGATSGGSSVVTGLPVATTSYSWKNLGNEGGKVFFYGVLRSGNVVSRFASEPTESASR